MAKKKDEAEMIDSARSGRSKAADSEEDEEGEE